MRDPLPAAIEIGRMLTGPYASTAKDGANGCFIICRERGPKTELRIISSDARGATLEGLPPWEHVSVSTATRCPTWDEMCRIKDLFWREDECVMQLHPPKAEWISNHEFCLHLWRPVGIAIPTPPGIMVGIKGVSSAQIKVLA